LFYIGAEKSKEQRCKIGLLRNVARMKTYGPKGGGERERERRYNMDRTNYDRSVLGGVKPRKIRWKRLAQPPLGKQKCINVYVNKLTESHQLVILRRRWEIKVKAKLPLCLSNTPL
jgi:hypothetical protein